MLTVGDGRILVRHENTHLAKQGDERLDVDTEFLR
jgi:hypothetical protein